jgi:endonuclease/exonuclease/phosphatase family metal-dependent hydrolase
MVGEEEEQMHNSNQHKRSAYPFGLSSFVTTTLILLALAIGQASSAMAEGMRVRLMTQNMYVGSAFSGLQNVTSVDQLKAAVTQIYNNILDSKPKERAVAVAQEIKREHPDIIALQEAWILRTGAAGAPATKVESDQLEYLLNELHQQGLQYEAIAILPNLDAQAPTQLDFDVRLTDRTVIIAEQPDLKLTNMRVQDYLVYSEVKPPVGPPIINKRGWASVELTVSGHSLQIATTHLDNVPPFAIQRAQAAEAIGILTNPDPTNPAPPIVFMGDFNVDPRVVQQGTYQLLDQHSGVSVALIQGGTMSAGDRSELASLGTLYYEPLWWFRRREIQVEGVAGLLGKKLSIGPEGSGTSKARFSCDPAVGTSRTSTPSFASSAR